MTETIQSPPPGADTEQIRMKVSQLCNLVNKLVANTPSDSAASDTAGIVSDFNDLLAVLRALNGK